MNTHPTNDQRAVLASYKRYLVKLQADDGLGVHYYVYAASVEQAKGLACRAELAPISAVRSVRISQPGRFDADAKLTGVERTQRYGRAHAPRAQELHV